MKNFRCVSKPHKNKLLNPLSFVSILSATFHFFAFFAFPLFPFCEYFDSKSERKLLKFCSLDFCRCCKKRQSGKCLVRGEDRRGVKQTQNAKSRFLFHLKHHHKTVTLTVEPQLLLHFLCLLSLLISLEVQTQWR